MPWWGFALLSAVAAAITTIAAKAGLAAMPSNLATALRTAVVLVFAWAIVIARGEHRQLGTITPRAYAWLFVSAVGTAASWLAYFRALQLGPASGVSAVDKSSLVMTLVLAVLILGEPLTLRAAIGAALIVLGAVLMIR
jgi:transporter family protein